MEALMGNSLIPFPLGPKPSTEPETDAQAFERIRDTMYAIKRLQKALEYIEKNTPPK